MADNTNSKLTKIQLIRRPIYIGLWISYVIWNLTSLKFIKYVFAFFILTAVVLAVRNANNSNKRISFILTVLGIGCLIYIKATPDQIIDAITSNGGLVALFISLPLFSILLKFNDYVGALDQVFRKFVKTSWFFFSLTSFFAAIIGVVLNVGGMTLMYELVEPYRPRYGNQKYLSQALSRGNLSMSFWAPSHMSVATVVAYTGLQWIDIAPKGILLSIIEIIIIAVAFKIVLKNKKPVLTEKEIKEATDTNINKPVITEFSIVYIGMVVFVAVLNKYTSIKVMAIICIAALVYPILTGICLKKFEIYKQGVNDYYNDKLGKIVNQVLLFFAVGFFGQAIKISGLGDAVISVLKLDLISSKPFLCMIIVYTIMALGLIGVHPIVPMIAFASTINPELVVLSPMQLAYCYLLGYSCGVCSNAFSAVALTLCGLTGSTKPFGDIAKNNILFDALLILIFSFIIPLI